MSRGRELSMEGTLLYSFGGRHTDVHFADETLAPAWDKFVELQPGAYGYHRWAWGEIFQRDLKLKVYRLAAWREGDLVGILPLVRQRLWPLPARLISLPFVNYAGVLARDRDAEDALLEAAVQLARQLRVTHIELRNTEPQAVHWARREDKVRFVLDVSPGQEKLWASLPGPRRTQVRRAQKDGLLAEVGGEELLDEFYRILARKWRDHGTPILPAHFYAAIMRHFPAATRICLVRSGTQAVAAGFLYRFGARVENPWVAALPEFSASRANILLYWAMIQESCRWGAQSFDFGRSSGGGGPYEFKKRWDAQEQFLPWSVWSTSRSGRPDDGFGADLLKRLWKRLPVGVANHFGPHVSRHLPL